MYVGPGGLCDGDGKQVLPVGNAQVGRGPGGLCETSQHRQGRIAQEWLHLSGEGEDRETESAFAVTPATHETVLLEGDHEAVDNGATHPEGRRDFRHGQALGGVGEHRKDP